MFLGRLEDVGTWVDIPSYDSVMTVPPVSVVSVMTVPPVSVVVVCQNVVVCAVL